MKRHLLIHTEERPWEFGICRQRLRHKEVMGKDVRGDEKRDGLKPNGLTKRKPKELQ